MENKTKYLYVTDYDNISIEGEWYDEAYNNLLKLKETNEDLPTGSLYVKCAESN
jgi:hypothetical protein